MADKDGETALGFTTWREAEAWAREWKRKRANRAGPEWYWPVEDGIYPLDDLLAPTNLRILRVLWRTLPPVHWPATVARQAGLARSTVYLALSRMSEWDVVEKVPAWNNDGSFCYRLRRDHPLVKMLDALFRAEARLHHHNATAPRRGGRGPS